MRSGIILTLAAALTATPLYAQDKAPTPPAAVPGMQDPQALMEAYAAAQAAAIRPGDEKLSCEELQTELGETMNDPVVQENIASAGAAAERDMAAIAEAQQAYDAQLAGSVAAGAAASAAPGGQWAALSKAAADAERSKAASAGRAQQHAMQARGAMEMMPQLMRGERLLELGAAKNCEFASSLGGGDSAGADASVKDPNP
jgi:hypothetical protein